MMIIIMQIILQPILFQPDKDIISSLEKTLSEEFDASSIVAAPPIKEISDQFFDKQRKQWKSNDILQWLSDKYKLFSKPTKILAICDFDAYSGNLNFVFGEADLDGSISAIYLPTLRQEFYGLKPDESVFGPVKLSVVTSHQMNKQSKFDTNSHCIIHENK
ncbi:MAG: hypothetical protein ACJ72J_19690 [Nitrososphaeraceae archaeon]